MTITVYEHRHSHFSGTVNGKCRIATRTVWTFCERLAGYSSGAAEVLRIPEGCALTPAGFLQTPSGVITADAARERARRKVRGYATAAVIV